MRGDVVNKVNWPICQTQEDAHADTKQPEHDFTPLRPYPPSLVCVHYHFEGRGGWYERVAAVMETVLKVGGVKTTGDGRINLRL